MDSIPSTMRFRAVVPKHCKAGESLRIQISDGTEATVTIPSGLVTGDSFVFELPTDQMKNSTVMLKEEDQLKEKRSTDKTSKEQQKHETNPPPKAIPTGQIETKPNSNDSIKPTSASLVLEDDGDEKTTKKPFLEREIIDCQDFVLALTVGLLVGSAIVFGFLMGIVNSTEAIFAVHPIEKPKQRSKQPPQHGRPNFPNSEPNNMNTI